MALTGEKKLYLKNQLTKDNISDMNELLEKKAPPAVFENFKDALDLFKHMRGQGVTNDLNEIEVLDRIFINIGRADLATYIRTGVKNPSPSVHVAAAAAATTSQPQTSAMAHASTVVVINGKKTKEEIAADKEQAKLQGMKDELSELKEELRSYGPSGNEILEELTIDPRTEKEITDISFELQDALDELKKLKEKLKESAKRTNKRIIDKRAFEEKEKARQQEAERSKRRLAREKEEQAKADEELEERVTTKLIAYTNIKPAPPKRDPKYFNKFLLWVGADSEFLDKKDAVEKIFWRHLCL